MLHRTRLVVLAAASAALYQTFIDLDAPAFPAGASICPERLAIHDVLRYRMYFEDYGDQKEALRLYAALEKNASVCASCSAPCLGSCPVGIPIQERRTGAHELLSLG